jgi:hypothetical protein
MERMSKIWKVSTINIVQNILGRHSRDCMVIGFTTTYAINAYHHWCEFEFRPGRGVQHYMTQFVSDLRRARWFSLGPPVSSTNKTDHHDIAEILLKVALYTIKQTNKQTEYQISERRWESVVKCIFIFFTIITIIHEPPTKQKVCIQQLLFFGVTEIW